MTPIRFPQPSVFTSMSVEEDLTLRHNPSPSLKEVLIKTKDHFGFSVGFLPNRSTYAAIFLCSVGVLMLEILLTRIFSFTIWYHLAYLTISTVLLSFGAAGSLLAAFPRLLKRPARLSAMSAAGAGVTILIAIFYLAPRPIDPATLFENPVPFFLGLLKYYVILTIPFLLADISIAAPLTAYPKRVNLLYASDLAGAALGCGLAVAALTWIDGVAALCAAAAILVAAPSNMLRQRRDVRACTRSRQVHVQPETLPIRLPLIPNAPSDSNTQGHAENGTGFRRISF